LHGYRAGGLGALGIGMGKVGDGFDREDRFDRYDRGDEKN